MTQYQNSVNEKNRIMRGILYNIESGIERINDLC
jgi:hypothetical protein